MEPASFALQHQLQEFTDYYSIPQNEYLDNKTSMPRLGNISHVCNDSIISNWDQRTESSTRSDVSPALYKESNLRTAGQGYALYDKHFTSQLHNDFLPTKLMDDVPDNFSNLREIIHSSSSRAPELLPPEEVNGSSLDFFSGRNMKGQTLTVSQYFIQAPDTSNNRRVNPKTPALMRPSLPFVSCSLGLNPQVQDMFTSPSYDGIYYQRMSYDNHDNIQGDSTRSYPSHSDSSIRGGTDDSPSNSSSKVISGTYYGRPRNYKRSTSFETKDSSAENRKKTKSSCPPLKIRKEKMGDRISALHRLVAPFGKTDTASVLTEAIGYIQFLQDQIQKLSVPYMTKSQSKPVRSVQYSVAEESPQPKRDLRSRGLCVVPLSFASCFNGCA